VLVVEIVLAALVVFGVAVVAMGYGGSITHFSPDWPGRALPEDRTLRADDVVAARFSLALRGYRMSEVDATLDRLAAEIAERDNRIEQLTGRPYEAPAIVGEQPPPETAADTAVFPVAEPVEPPPELSQARETPLFDELDRQASSDNPYAPPRENRSGE
jgi:DivIVA domain-containing protein